MDQLLLLLALHAGVQHTHIDKDDGSPDGYGPRLDAEIAIQPVPPIAIGVVGGLWHYSTAGLDDGVTHTSYDIRMTHLAAGLRLYVQPHPRVFVGVTLWANRETETVTSMDSTHHGSSSRVDHVWEPMIGGALARIGRYDLQVMATFSHYSTYSGLEDVQMYSLMFGVRGATPIRGR